MSPEDKRARLAAALQRGELVIAPGVFEMISAKLADRQGFAALYMTGYGVAASHLGLPDAGIASYTDVLERVRTLADGIDTPLICDADTGFGGLLNIRNTVRGFEAAGCAALQLEDQESPKKCGLTRGVAVIETAAMLRKLGVALEARRDPNLLIIGRTDARGSLGMDEALRRASAYAKVGADLVFVQGLVDEAELSRARDTVEKLLVVNISGRDGLGSVAPDRLHELGCGIAIYPGTSMLAAAAAMDETYAHLASARNLAGLDIKLFDREEMHRLMGFEDVWDFERRWLE
jgi:2-methylisocitrate lyase-like PEP mutase family enzyme